jgi:hypothetical protein
MWLIADNASAYVASAFWPKEAEMAGDNYYYASTLVLMIHWIFLYSESFHHHLYCRS